MESYCSCIAKSIIKEQSVKVLSEIRKQFFGLLSVGFRADSIVERLSFLFVQQTSPKYHVDIINMASEYVLLYLLYNVRHVDFSSGLGQQRDISFRSVLGQNYVTFGILKATMCTTKNT